MAALPSTGITTSMVASAIGAATNDVGRLCTHPNVNKWSKWKPVRFNSVSPITQAQLASVNFGITPPTPSNDYTTVMDTKWGYSRPTGGLSSPYRLSDFRNYNKTAGAIAYVPETLHIDKSITTSREIALLMNISGTDFLIGLNDFIGDIGDYYYGAIIEERANRYIITSDKTLANGGSSFTLDFTQSPFNLLWENYTIRHLLISRPSPTIQTLGSFGAAYYMSIPTADGDVNFTKMTVSLAPPNEIDMSFTHVGVNQSANLPISNYQSIDGASLQTSGALYLRAQLKNNTSSTKVFQYPNEIEISPTFFGDTYRGGINIYKDGVLQTGAQISIPASSTIELVMGNTNLINRENGIVASPPAGIEIFPVINLYRNNYRISGTSLKLKS
jgi:hypothetical protein